MVGKALLKKLIILRVLETYGESDKNTVCLPRQGIPFCLRLLYLLDFWRFRAGRWDTFEAVDSCDIAYWAGEISSRGEVTPASLYYVCICLREKQLYLLENDMSACWRRA